jgi:tetrapyrrole methylase family protein/MazG family protein
MIPSPRDLRTFTGLRRIVATLRAPGGCLWDRVQTHETLRPYLIEEAYETLAALDDGDAELLCEELGDLLLEVLLHVQIAEESGGFRLRDVIYSISSKLVRRHPHVFGDAVADTPEAVVEQWDDLKRRERGEGSALTGIPIGLPSLAYAQAVQRRASKAGFAFESPEQAWEALEEELEEFRAAQTPEARAEEIGDALFALANVARWHDVDAEDVLRDTSRGFTRRFRRVEDLVRERGVDLRQAELQDKLALWEEAKADAG